ncbi:MAG TPA: IS110 family transposase [Magnetococcales bacterium]|nr:IS110 family transposase [Magnetococcales bacterium]
MGNITVLGVDLAKSVFHLHGVDQQGKVVLKKRLDREKMLPFFANLPPCLIGLEACSSSHYWAREIRKLGHDVRLMNPIFVKPYVKNDKNDYNDAEGICEAVSRPSMRFVPIKTVTQQDIQALHRVRSQLIQERTALANQTRGLLGEYGIVIGRGIGHLRTRLPSILDDADNQLTEIGRGLFSEQYHRMVEFDDKIAAIDNRIETLFKNDRLCMKIEKIPGISKLTVTAILAAVGDGHEFRNGRQMAVWLGLVPRQNSTGGKTRLGGISKRGDSYLRTLLIHGARSVVYRAIKKDDPRSQWINSVRARRGENVACVALANKNARIIWAMMVNEQEYRIAA